MDYSVSSGPFLRFSMRFEFLSEMFDHLVCETRDPSLTIRSSPRIDFDIFEYKTVKMFGEKHSLFNIWFQVILLSTNERS